MSESPAAALYVEQRPDGAALVRFDLPGEPVNTLQAGFADEFTRVFSALERQAVVVDLVSTSEVSISCTIEKQEDAERAKAELEEHGTVSIATGRAILAIVGEGMKFQPGLKSRML